MNNVVDKLLKLINEDGVELLPALKRTALEEVLAAELIDTLNAEADESAAYYEAFGAMVEDGTNTSVVLGAALQLVFNCVDILSKGMVTEAAGNVVMRVSEADARIAMTKAINQVIIGSMRADEKVSMESGNE